MKTCPRNLKGLTLVELLVVLGIVAILSGITLVIINPNKQRNRSRDGVLKNSITSIGQALDSFYGIKGFYPDPTYPSESGDPSKTQLDDLIPYIKSFSFVQGSGAYQNTSIVFSNPTIYAGGLPNGDIVYHLNDFTTGDTIKDIPCVEAVSNEDPTTFIAWAPGFAVQTLTASCSSEAGYTQLTGITP